MRTNNWTLYPRFAYVHSEGINMSHRWSYGVQCSLYMALRTQIRLERVKPRGPTTELFRFPVICARRVSFQIDYYRDASVRGDAASKDRPDWNRRFQIAPGITLLDVSSHGQHETVSWNFHDVSPLLIALSHLSPSSPLFSPRFCRERSLPFSTIETRATSLPRRPGGKVVFGISRGIPRIVFVTCIIRCGLLGRCETMKKLLGDSK